MIQSIDKNNVFPETIIW